MPATSPLLSLLLALVLVAGAPVRYDQRQEGDFNVHAHLENFVVVLIPTAGSGNGGLGILDFLKKSGANVRTAEQPIQVTVVEGPPKDQQQSKEDPQQEQQQQREGEEDLQAAGTQALEAVLVAESPALVLSRAATGHQGQPPPEEPAAAELVSTQRREGKAVREGAGTGGCPQGHFRDATGVCHYIGSDQRIGDQSFFGLEPPFED
ncbi:uncharacterized protein LOC124622533 [Schistocerca americana]|uniref:uncharacterized protein LOC124622533 n=1 Tax=Schistocerca americana TaxID=7009 RepID=UPI001F4F15B2|nr:uncharacterized protein LOC124622533 [Schistocerca americana]